MMGGRFGDGIVSLLDTYSRCLSLLKALSRGSKRTREQKQLGSSIRSSRNRVSKYYYIKASESGSSFETGDATARSSLRRLVRRLTAFLDRVLHAFGKDNHTNLDYDSLAALSRGTGLEAIRTMSDLSERVSTRSSISNEGAKHRESWATSDKDMGNSDRRRRSISTGSRRSKSSGSRSKLSKQPPASQQRRRRESWENRRRNSSDDGHGPSHQKSRSGATGVERRESTATSSSDSTKLGETRPGIHARQGQATYPLWSYPREPVKLKKGRLFGLFGR